MIRVAVVADNGAVRADLADALASDAQLECAIVASSDEIASRIEELRPDVIVIQSGTPSRERHDPEVPTVLLFEGDEELAHDVTGSDIVAAVVAAHAGIVVRQPRSGAHSSLEAPLAENLTRRERSVLERLALGAANKEIALQLNISEHTVKFHVASILAKLGAGNRAEAVSRGVKLGLLML